LPIVGSTSPPEAGKVAVFAASLAGLVALSFTLCFFRKERKALSRVSLAAPEPIGS